MHKEMSIMRMRDCGFIAREMCNDIKVGIVTEEQGKEALFNLLLTACGAKEKECKKK